MAALAALAVVGLVIVNSTQGGPGDGEYANDNYQVPAETKNPPPLPEYPKTFDEAYALLEKNPLYSQQVPKPVRCEVSGDPSTMSNSQLDAYLTEEMACLTRLWQPPLNAAGYTEVRPAVTVYSDRVTSACGTQSGNEAINAFYCAGDQQVYFSTLMFKALPDLKKPNVVTLVMAHEYGHNVQGRSNLLIPTKLIQSNIDDESESLELNRRLEVQADCFAGLFLGSAAQSLGLTSADFTTLEGALNNIGDDVLSGKKNIEGNHGWGANRQLWGSRGWSTVDIGQCNTFTAPAKEVQ